MDAPVDGQSRNDGVERIAIGEERMEKQQIRPLAYDLTRDDAATGRDRVVCQFSSLDWSR
jgi:hypothetical protein